MIYVCFPAGSTEPVMMAFRCVLLLKLVAC